MIPGSPEAWAWLILIVVILLLGFYAALEKKGP